MTEWRDGAVYKTEFVRKDWVPMGAHKVDDLIVVPISTKDPDIHTLPRRKK